MSYTDTATGCTWTRTVAPVLEPLSVSDAKLQARYPSSQTADDASFTAYIQAAREAAEDCLRRGLLTQTWVFSLPCFYDVMWLPMAAPLASVTSVKYYDTAGNQQTLATTYYTVDTSSRPGRVVRAADQAWPALQSGRVAPRVEITYVVGWTAANLVPEKIKQGMRLFITAMDRNRDGFEPQGDYAGKAIEACWTDSVPWIAPSNRCEGGYR